MAAICFCGPKELDPSLLNIPATGKTTKEEYEETFTDEDGEAPIPLSEIPFNWGSELMEVLDIRIISNKEKNKKLNMNGTVYFDANYGMSVLYHRPPQNPEVVRSQDALTLTGPHIAATLLDYCHIVLDIKDGQRELCRGFLPWNMYNHDHYVNNRGHVHKVVGKHGFAHIACAYFTDAILINVEIKLPKMDVFNSEVPANNDSVKIYGKIDASIKGYEYEKSIEGDEHEESIKGDEDEESTKEDKDKDEGKDGDEDEDEEVILGSLITTLFRRKHTDSVSMNVKGGVLPLSKSLIAFPLEGEFEISVHLEEHLPGDSGNCTIAKAIVACTPKHFGDELYKIESKYGTIEIELTAYPLNSHPKSCISHGERMVKLLVP